MFSYAHKTFIFLIKNNYENRQILFIFLSKIWILKYVNKTCLLEKRCKANIKQVVKWEWWNCAYWKKIIVSLLKINGSRYLVYKQIIKQKYQQHLCLIFSREATELNCSVNLQTILQSNIIVSRVKLLFIWTFHHSSQNQFKFNRVWLKISNIAQPLLFWYNITCIPEV